MTGVLSSLLFVNKPLSRIEMERAHDLLGMSSVTSRLISTQQTLIDQASGKIATRLLSFLGETRKTKDQVQLAVVCSSLRKPGEISAPIHDQALRRAATWGRLFELKVLIKSMPKSDLNKIDATYERTALHWAVSHKNLDCARALVEVGALLDIRDKEGQTPLHKAVINGDRPMIEMLIKSGASIDIKDANDKSPDKCTTDQSILLFINDCHAYNHPQILKKYK
ncbi:ankyrin repeat domain-containing protein [Legionella gresilensis]|uniref:ankyrin repeat domain-containing protein n=1 Tax=Legionella gresilensis TaxID=91823 RepID=UPI00104106CB|nr:ankyrin repeat domain-containing protein [Legionella gresilensis]